MTKAFITGATGNIGQHLIPYLLEMDIPFTAASRTIAATADYPTTMINFSNTDQLVAAFRGHDLLFLLTPDTPETLQWVNNAITAAKQVGVRHLVRASGIGADSDAPYFVFRTLGEIENVVKQSGLSYTILRPNSFFQNFATFYNQGVRQGEVYLPHEGAKVSYVDVRDVALAIATVIAKPDQHINQTYTITGAEAIADQTLLDRIGAVLGQSITWTPISDEEMAVIFRQLNLPDYTIRTLISLYQANRAGETAQVFTDFTQITQRQPRTINAFAQDYQHYWR